MRNPGNLYALDKRGSYCLLPHFYYPQVGKDCVISLSHNFPSINRHVLQFQMIEAKEASKVIVFIEQTEAAGLLQCKDHARLEQKQLTFVWTAGSCLTWPPRPSPARLRKTGETVGCWCRPWGLPSLEEEMPGLHMASSHPWQPHTDLWTFYLYNSLVSLSLFLYNCLFASLPLIRILVRHHIKTTNNWCSHS